VVTAPAGILGILARVLIVDDLDSAHAVRRRIIDVPDAATTIVTRAGERVTSYTIHAGSGAGRSRLELAAERDAAAERLAEITVVADSLREALADAQTTWNDARARTKDALQSLREHDAALAAHTEQVNRATVRHEAAVAECERLEAGLAQASSAVADAERAARVANDAFEGAQQAPRPILDASARDGLLDALEVRATARCARVWMSRRCASACAPEGRVDQLVRQRERERAAAAEAARRAVIRRAQRALAAEVADALPPVLDSVDRSVTQARVELQLAEQARTALTAELTSLRAEEATVRERLGRLTESVHGLELQMHEKRLHVTSLLDRVRSELSLDENILVAEYGPDVPLPGRRREPCRTTGRRSARGCRMPSASSASSARQSARARGVRRARAAARVPHRAARRSRPDAHRPADDHRGARRTHADDLPRGVRGHARGVRRGVPDPVPGRLRQHLPDRPDSPLTTGIEVSVRPVGKKIERLSLLSGGERSLAAVALLTAIFMARPSPFYILDEVEAALDDANLGACWACSRSCAHRAS
jgi:chromosome segregation protein